MAGKMTMNIFLYTTRVMGVLLIIMDFDTIVLIVLLNGVGLLMPIRLLKDEWNEWQILKSLPFKEFH